MKLHKIRHESRRLQWRRLAEPLPLLISRSHRRVILLGRFTDLSARELVTVTRVLRRVTPLTDNHAFEFIVEDHNRQGWTIDSTFFAELAFAGTWDVCLAQADNHNQHMIGQSGSELLKAAGVPIRAAELWLLATRSPNPSLVVSAVLGIEHVVPEFAWRPL